MTPHIGAMIFPASEELQPPVTESPLPRRSVAQRIIASTGETGALAGRQVLVVEDEYFQADDVAQALRKLGAQVMGPVATVQEALALLANEPVDVAVLDINLRGDPVYPVVDVLQAEGVPFVFATGYGEAAIPPSLRDIPRWQKPYRLDDLVKALPAIALTA